jgi:hypothetical protein
MYTVIIAARATVAISVQINALIGCFAYYSMVYIFVLLPFNNMNSIIIIKE